MKRMPSEKYITERVEAHNVAISALRTHEPADGDKTGLARRLRNRLADRLDREIDRWLHNLPTKK